VPWTVVGLRQFLQFGWVLWIRFRRRQRTFFPEGRAWEPQANFDVPVAMLSRAETYEKKAAECEREGDRAATPVLKSKYRGVAQQWREMAEQERRSAVSKRPKKVRVTTSVS
jgi:hypothetical protein